MRSRFSSSAAKTQCVMFGLAGVLVIGASASASTDKATWITEASDYVLNYMPQVEALMWFNNYKPGVNEPDWRIVPEAPTLPDMNVVNAYNNAWHGMVNGSYRVIETGVFIDGAPADMSKIDRFPKP